ncbi:MAG: ABC transporter substrate-binding protein [Hyphomicrobiales bacterium]|nr:ABC transporter substrate-binding protein [Hyphomicrobiales bacterium]
MNNIVKAMGAVSLVAIAMACAAPTPAEAQDLRQVPRNRTFVTQGWDFYNQVQSPSNLSPYNGVLLNQRQVLHYTVTEPLFFTNHIRNELIPWQEERMETSADFREVTITLRPNVRWADGRPLTSADLVFTFDTLRANAPEMALSGAMREWVESATARDERTVVVRLTKPGPRWAQDMLATGQVTRFVVLPKHVWEGKDPKTFGNFDLAQGWPLGTGPYRVVRSDANSMVMDRLDRWWAIDAGLVQALPAPERVIYRPATADAMAQLYTANEIDAGRSIQVGAFEAARARNPNLISWNRQGPVWGVPSGCTHRLAFNNQSPPFDRADVRRAIATIIDRNQIADLAWEGSAPTTLAPFSSYPGMQAYVTQMDAQIRQAAGKTDPRQAEQMLTASGFSRGPDQKWRLPDGQPWQVTINTQQGEPIAPVVARQLQSAGIDAVFRPLADAQYFDAMASGSYAAVVGVHCGSLYDPWQTLEHFHSKYAPNAGARAPNLRAITRYRNPELDALLERMEAMRPSPTNAAYVDLVRQATAIVMRDMPQISLTEEVHTMAMNSTHWTGWPTAADPYVAPFVPWDGYALIVHRLRPRS